LKILVIDDNTTILAMISRALGRRGHHVETATRGKVGLQKFKRERFEMVITDQIMPDLGGAGVAKMIRNSDRNATPIIATSGTPWRVKDDCFDTFLPKPFSIKDLVNCVDGLSPSRKICFGGMWPRKREECLGNDMKPSGGVEKA
jgi:DNA-binding response OmpR family regulator